jgi:hypothetical protein
MIFKRRSFFIILAGVFLNCFRRVFNLDLFIGTAQKWADNESKIYDNYKSKAHHVLDRWLIEVPYDICSDEFRDILKNEIEDVIGYKKKIINVKDFGAVPGTFANSSFEAAVSATPSGGTLIIPVGTWLINNWEIKKSIRILCHGTLKRVDFGESGQVRSNYMVRLSSPCMWDGGLFDSNFRSWKAGEPSNRLYLLRNSSNSIIRNIEATDCARKQDGYNWGGFRNENGNSYWVNCSAEYAARCFSNQAIRQMYSEKESGEIDVFKGVYFYKCSALNFTEKGFDSGGSHGWIVYDNCDGHRISQDKPNSNNADELFLLETGNDNKLHTAIIKNCRVEGHHSAQMIKSSGVKYMIMADNHLVTWGFFNNSVNQPGRIYFAQIKSTPQHAGTFEKTIGIFLNNHFECRNFDDGINTYFPNITGRCHPLTSNWNGLRQIRDLTSEFYLYNCTIKMEGIRSDRYSLELKNFYAESCTFIKVLSGNAFQYFRPRGIDLKPNEGYRYQFKNCTFMDESGNNTWVVDIDDQNGGSLEKGVITVHEPKGNFRAGVAPSYTNISE